MCLVIMLFSITGLVIITFTLPYKRDERARDRSGAEEEEERKIEKKKLGKRE